MSKDKSATCMSGLPFALHALAICEESEVNQKRIALVNRVIELSNGSTAPISFRELAQLRNLAEMSEERSLEDRSLALPFRRLCVARVL
jgi:hypothetical protein